MVRLDHGMFRNYTLMSVQTYEKLLGKIGSRLFSAQTRPNTITSSEKFPVTLRYLATGESYTSLSRSFQIGVSTVNKFIHETLGIIWDKLQQDVLVLPDSADKWFQIIDEFDQIWQFPNCFGAIDEKQAQPRSGSDYYNYKHFHSIILLAMCDANYDFIMVDVGGRGRQSDGGVFKNCDFYERPQVYVSDTAFGLRRRGMRPFAGAGTGSLSKDKKLFNYRLSRARRTTENDMQYYSPPLNSAIGLKKVNLL
ncbi:uncharacterized protein LOC117182584 [Belonocnema kinseyi]|uniref:uncharacterized protein LOC117182584 n=1 Tax=Belonocnema kinseyi TaxID=2817044 RepID=UPI00143D0D7D|nr:uncharacterized protein LOC117182584 [Belonocnema kinseyi]